MEYDEEAGYHFAKGTTYQKFSRIGFVRKVYGILSCQLAFTAAFSYLMAMNESLSAWQLDNMWALWTSIVFSIVFIIIICCCRSLSRQVPINYLLLAGFTFCETYLVSCVITVYTVNGMGDLVIIAAMLTVAMTVSLTIYAWTTKEDLTVCGGTLFCLCIGLFLLGLLAWLTNLQFLHILYCILGIILYGIYLVYDTQLIMGGKRFELSVDDYIIAAVQLYLDVVLIFLEILELLGRAR